MLRHIEKVVIAALLGFIPAGDVFYVDSGHAAKADVPKAKRGYVGHGTTPDKPFATLDYAIGQCTASNGDVIVVAYGHAEAVTATSIVADVAGITILGLGQGTNCPVFTFGATDSIFTISAANIRVENIRCVSDVDNVVKCFDLSAAADGAVLRNVTIVDGASNKEFLIHIAVATGCHDLTFDTVRVFGLGGGATACLKFAGTSDRLVMKNCQMQGTFSAGLVDASAGILLNQAIFNNILHNRDTSAGLCYKGNASSTGYLVENYVLGAKSNTEPISTVTAMHCAENYGTDVAATTGILTPATPTAWS